MKVFLSIVLGLWAALALPGLLVAWWWAGSPFPSPSDFSDASSGWGFRMMFYYVVPILAGVGILFLKRRGS
jgi:hypothetical protein